MISNYFVFKEYSFSSICEVISHFSNCPFEQVKNKPQLQNLNRQLKDTCLSILLERKYLESDYLSDFEDYYGSCFSSYSRKCIRIHFFKEAYTNKTFSSLSNEEQGGVAEQYLGYIVIKPLPEFFIGKSCLNLKVVEIPDSKKMTVAYKHCVHLYGMRISIVGVPFVEQDNITSACSSSSLWVMLKALCKDAFNHFVPSPSKITKIAKNANANAIIQYPYNQGLNMDQMANVLSNMGYGHRIFKAEGITTSNIKIFIKAGFPIILGLNISRSSGIQVGNHAVCIIGYREQDGETLLVVNDDQRGLNLDAEISDKSFSYIALADTCDYVYEPVTMLVGLDPTIRNGTENIDRIGDLFLTLFNEQTNIFCIKKEQLFLISNNRLKEACSNSDKIIDRCLILSSSWPKYLWVLPFYSDDEKNNLLFYIIFDTTDIDHGSLFLDFVFF